ncbi:MAG: hypothetical protein E7539_01115 [Ruminococcaceae bacterium]|nr:hypothetical protein [Oscillospiraceae bacterium]
MSFFDSIMEWFSIAGDLIMSMVEALITAISVIGTAIVMPSYISPYVPAFLASSVICVVSFAVVKFLVGR